MTMKNPGDNLKTVVLTAPVSQAAGVTTTGEVDCTGFTHCLIVLTAGVLTNEPITLIHVEGATASGGSFADIAGATIPDFAFATDDGEAHRVSIDLTNLPLDAALADRPRKFLRLVATIGGTGPIVAGVNAHLARPEDTTDFHPQADTTLV